MQEASPTKRETLRSILGLTEEEAASVGSGAEAAAEMAAKKADDDSFF